MLCTHRGWGAVLLVVTGHHLQGTPEFGEVAPEALLVYLQAGLHTCWPLWEVTIH